jgi:hypothetical protein
MSAPVITLISGPTALEPYGRFKTTRALEAFMRPLHRSPKLTGAVMWRRPTLHLVKPARFQ